MQALCMPLLNFDFSVVGPNFFFINQGSWQDHWAYLTYRTDTGDFIYRAGITYGKSASTTVQYTNSEGRVIEQFSDSVSSNNGYNRGYFKMTEIPLFDLPKVKYNPYVTDGYALGPDAKIIIAALTSRTSADITRFVFNNRLVAPMSTAVMQDVINLTFQAWGWLGKLGMASYPISRLAATPGYYTNIICVPILDAKKSYGSAAAKFGLSLDGSVAPELRPFARSNMNSYYLNASGEYNEAIPDILFLLMPEEDRVKVGGEKDKLLFSKSSLQKAA